MILVLLVGPISSARICALTPCRCIFPGLCGASIIFSASSASSRVSGHGDDRPVLDRLRARLVVQPGYHDLRDTLPLLLAQHRLRSVIVVSAGTLILALSSLSRNSRYVALFWVACGSLACIVSSVLEDIEQAQRMRQTPSRVTSRRLVGINQPDADLLPKSGWRASKTDWRPLISYTATFAAGAATARHRRGWEKLSRAAPAGAKRHASPVQCRPAISLVLVGRRAGRDSWTFRMHPELYESDRWIG